MNELRGGATGLSVYSTWTPYINFNNLEPMGSKGFIYYHN